LDRLKATILILFVAFLFWGSKLPKVKALIVFGVLKSLCFCE
jgi:hypothetical protein